jgi:hypothetical protein
VSPTLVDSPQTAVVVTPEVAAAVSVPSVPDNQRYDYTPDGLLVYQFQLQNKTPGSFFLRVKATFFDDKGTVVDDQLSTRLPMNEYEIKAVKVTCSNALGRKVRVQVSAAN